MFICSLIFNRTHFWVSNAVSKMKVIYLFVKINIHSVELAETCQIFADEQAQLLSLCLSPVQKDVLVVADVMLKINYEVEGRQTWLYLLLDLGAAFLPTVCSFQ